MTRRQALALSLAGFAIAPGATSSLGQSPLPYPRTLIPTRTSLERVGLEKGWSGSVPLGYGTERVLSMNLAGDMVFAQTNMGHLHAFQAETGKYLWGARAGHETVDVRPVSVNSTDVFVTNGTDMIALDKRTGRPVWRTRMEGTAVGATAATEEEVMVGLASGKLVAYSTRDHSKDKIPGRSAGTFAWAWQTNGAITARPVPAGRVVAFASHDARLYVAIEKPPSMLFRYLSGGPIVGSLGTHGTRTVIVPSMDRTLYAIDLFTGDTKWTVATGASLDQEPLVDRDTVIVINTAGRIMAIDANSGEIKRSGSTGGGRLLAGTENRAYFLSRDRDLAVFDRNAGRMLYNPRDTRERAGLNLRDYELAVTNAENDRMYLGTHSGFILCLREAGLTQPRTLRPANAPKFGYISPDGEQPIATPPETPTEPDAESATEPAADPDN